jgi:hypothetical protein
VSSRRSGPRAAGRHRGHFEQPPAPGLRPRRRSPPHWPRRRPVRPCTCRSSRPRCGGGSRNSPRPRMGSRAQNDPHSTRSRPARTPPGRLRRSTTTRGGSLPRRHLVLPSPRRARARNDEAPRNQRRHTLSPAAPARRRTAVCTRRDAADSNRQTHLARPSRPSRPARHRPLDRRHPHHARQHLAMGFDTARARRAISALATDCVVWVGQG